MRLTPTEKDIQRFWSKVDRKGHNECWPWIAKNVHYRGYGLFNMQYSVFSAHQVAYCIYYNEEPATFQVKRSCDNKLCCNPLHIYKRVRRVRNKYMAQLAKANPISLYWDEERASYMEGTFLSTIAAITGVPTGHGARGNHKLASEIVPQEHLKSFVGRGHNPKTGKTESLYIGVFIRGGK